MVLTILTFLPLISYAANACLENPSSHLIKSRLLLKLDNCKINDSDISIVIDMVNAYSIRTVLLNNNELTDTGIVRLLKAVNINFLDISNNEVHDNSLHAIANTHIEWLILGNAKITHDGLQALNKNTYLKRILISDTSLDDQALKAIANNSNLMDITLSKDNITGDQAAIFANIHTLKLDLSDNPIGDKGIKALANVDAKAVGCNYCQAGDDALIAIAKSQKIYYLQLAHNHIGDKGALTFAANYQANLIVLDVSSNAISKQGIIALQQLKNVGVLTDNILE